MRINAGLFRGKATTTGEWLYGSLLKVTIKGCPIWIIFEDNFDITGDIVKAMSHACVDPDTVGECTGLTDKNGKLVFEGDIVQYYGTHELEVFIEKGHATIRWFDTIIKSECNALFFGCDEEDFGECEIIGTVHDNPELLKGGEG